MTKEEIENNYTFKLIKRALTRDLPYIKDIKVDNEDIDKYKYTLFIDIIIDPYQMVEYYDTELWGLIENKLKRGEGYDTSAVGVMIGSPDKHEIAEKINKDIVNVIKQIQDASVVPNELKLKKRVYPMTFIVEPTNP